MSLLDLASLVLAPTATKEGKVYSAIPDTGQGDMTFSRGSAATRVNSEGLIEKERANLLLQSNTFDTTWATNNASVTGGQSGYDGSSDAWKVDISAAAGKVQQSISTSGVQTISFYAKSGTCDFVRVTVDGGNGIYFNLSSGTKGTILGSIIDSNIEQVGATDWYRCSMAISQAITALSIYPAIDDNNLTGTSGNIYIQDAMLNNGLVAQPYIETTTTAVYEGITDDVPRVDYSGGGCPSLLLEPQRTNILPQSEYVNSTDWIIGAGVTITNNYAESPEGVQNATRAQFGATGVNRVFYDRAAATSDADNVWSFYIKGTDGETIDCYIDGNATGTGYYYFGKYITLDGTWQRIEFPFTLPANAGTQNYVVRRQVGNTATEALFYGFQVEASASYATSYIPTYSVSSTRVADSCSKTGISELIGQTEGTMFIEFTRENNSVGTFSISANNVGTRIYIGTNASGLICQVRNGYAQQAYFSTAQTEGTTYKCAIAYATNDFVLYMNGTQIGTDTSGTVPACNTIRTDDAGGANLNQPLKQALLFPTRLTNDQLEELTK